MAETINLKNGRQVTLIQDEDFERMIYEELGSEAADYFVTQCRKPLMNVETCIQRASEIIGDALEDVLSSIYNVNE